jgi:hypothetical protein
VEAAGWGHGGDDGTWGWPDDSNATSRGPMVHHMSDIAVMEHYMKYVKIGSVA